MSRFLWAVIVCLLITTSARAAVISFSCLFPRLASADGRLVFVTYPYRLLVYKDGARDSWYYGWAKEEGSQCHISLSHKEQCLAIATGHVLVAYRQPPSKFLNFYKELSIWATSVSFSEDDKVIIVVDEHGQTHRFEARYGQPLP